MKPQFFPGIQIDTVAVVGISEFSDRPSYIVAKYLRENGYRIIPINPNITEWCGITAYPDLTHVPEQIRIDLVNIFRRSEDIFTHVKEAADRKDILVIWLPEGVSDIIAKEYAEQHGKICIMNACLMKQHTSQKIQ